MTGLELITDLKKKFRVSTDSELSQTVGISTQSIQNWKKRPSVTSRQAAGLVCSASKAAARSSHAGALRTIVEFFPISATQSRQGKKSELFGVRSENGDKHVYLEGLRKELATHSGVYVFFDSRGRALYVGKAKKQFLWKEMNDAFNRKRKGAQVIWRVSHPVRNQPYKTSLERPRQIASCQVPLHELAAYFSAYEVADGMIDNVEAMLVRSFANDLSNKRMERLGKR